VFQRHMREKNLTAKQVQALWSLFEEDLGNQVWNLLPVTDPLLRRTALAVRRLPATAFLRAGDALHLVTAREYGFTEIWTSDRRMLAAAPHFGLQGRVA